jgi:hypothetical protein
MGEGPGGVELPGAKPAPPPPKDPTVRDYTGRDTFQVRPQKPGETYRDRPQVPSEKKEPVLGSDVIDAIDPKDPTRTIKYKVYFPTGHPDKEVYRRRLSPETEEGGEAVAPLSHKVGDTVTLKNVGKVVITKMNPDGTFEYRR